MKKYKLLHLLTGKWFSRNTAMVMPIFTDEPYLLSKTQLEETIRNGIKIGCIFIWDSGSFAVSCYNEFEIIEVLDISDKTN